MASNLIHASFQDYACVGGYHHIQLACTRKTLSGKCCTQVLSAFFSDLDIALPKQQYQHNLLSVADPVSVTFTVSNMFWNRGLRQTAKPCALVMCCFGPAPETYRQSSV